MIQKKQLDRVLPALRYFILSLPARRLFDHSSHVIIGRAVLCLRLKLDGDSLKVLVRHGVSRDPLVLKVFLGKHDACVFI